MWEVAAIFIVGWFFGVFCAAGIARPSVNGYTLDRRIVSGQPFEVDDEVYQCTFVSKKGAQS